MSSENGPIRLKRDTPPQYYGKRNRLMEMRTVVIVRAEGGAEIQRVRAKAG
jgi:hypothetical protein